LNAENTTDATANTRHPCTAEAEVNQISPQEEQRPRDSAGIRRSDGPRRRGCGAVPGGPL